MFMQEETSHNHGGKLRSVVSIILSLCLIISCLNIVAFAQDKGFTPVDSKNYFGRQKLATLPNGESLVYAYDRIAKGVENCQQYISVQNNNCSIVAEELEIVINAYRWDYPQHFWLTNRYGYRHYENDDVVQDVTPTYSMTGNSLKKAKEEFDKTVDAIVAKVTPDMSQFELEKYFHDYLASIISYQNSSNAHNAYGALLEGIAVCEGYAKAFQYLLYQVGIMNTVVSGTSMIPGTSTPENHAWNLVLIDGEYYYVDLTWDDQQDYIFYAYFNITTDRLKEDHTLDPLAYSLPQCTSQKANYFHIYGGIMDEFSTQTIVNASRKNGNFSRVFLNGDTNNFRNELINNLLPIKQQLNYVVNPKFSYVSLGRERLILFLGGRRRGDINNDTLIDSEDIQALIDHLCGIVPLTNSTDQQSADINQDGTITVLDAQRLYEHITEKRYIDPEKRTTPLTAKGDATLTVLPQIKTTSGDNDTKEVEFTFQLIPPEEGSIGCCDFTVIPPKGSALKELTVSPDLLWNQEDNSGYFTTAFVEKRHLLLSGSENAITEPTVIGTVTLIIEKDASAKDYIPKIQLGDCGADGSTLYKFYYVPTVPEEEPSDTPSEDESNVSQPSDVPSIDSPSQDESSANEPSKDESSDTPVIDQPVTSEPIDTPSQDESSDSSQSPESSEEPQKPIQIPYGDVSNDNVINATDALYVLQSAVNKKTLTPEQILAADVSGDGKLDAVDSLLILQFAVGKIQSFPVEK
jgi:hypothetical protein